MTPRLQSLIAALGLSQKAMARRLGCSQPTVCRICNGQPEPGPVSALADLIATEAGRPDLTAAAYAAAQADAAPPAPAPPAAPSPPAAPAQEAAP